MQFISLSYQLQKAGFSNLDAIDGSAGMLEVARKKNIYNNIICDIIGPNTLKIENGELHITYYRLWHREINIVVCQAIPVHAF